MSFEIERKFVINNATQARESVSSLPHSTIKQFYLHKDESHECRVRFVDAQSCITFKRGVGLKRVEVEIDVPTSSAEQLVDPSQVPITKRRYEVTTTDNRVVHVDVYVDITHDLRYVANTPDPLIVCEIEFDDVDQASNCKAVSDDKLLLRNNNHFMVTEVTNSVKYSNASLFFNVLPNSRDVTTGV